MRVLLITTDYEAFLEDHYGAQPTLKSATYQTQLEARYASWFSGGDSISSRFVAAGHETFDIFANNRWMQSAWVRERDARAQTADPLSRRSRAETLLRNAAPKSLKTFASGLPGAKRTGASWMYEVLAAQFDHYRPDVVINQSMDFLDHRFFKEVRAKGTTLVGFHSAVALPRVNLTDYDLVIASFPPTAAAAVAAGTKVALVRLAFDRRLLQLMPERAYHQREIEIAFIGSFGVLHKGRTRLLEMVCERFEGLRIWGANAEDLPQRSCLRSRYVGSSWGLGMYDVLAQTRIVINGHGDIPPFAANSRMYEATGCGALLVTDWKPDLHEIFCDRVEVLAYRDEGSCLDLVEQALSDTAFAGSVAAAGRKRTLEDHTYDERVPQMIEAIESVL